MSSKTEYIQTGYASDKTKLVFETNKELLDEIRLAHRSSGCEQSFSSFCSQLIASGLNLYKESK
jgi:hypothetical protein